MLSSGYAPGERNIPKMQGQTQLLYHLKPPNCGNATTLNFTINKTYVDILDEVWDKLTGQYHNMQFTKQVCY
jgi:hypothetical protein